MNCDGLGTPAMVGVRCGKKRRFKIWKAQWLWKALWSRRCAVCWAFVLCCALLAGAQQPSGEKAAPPRLPTDQAAPAPQSSQAETPPAQPDAQTEPAPSSQEYSSSAHNLPEASSPPAYAQARLSTKWRVNYYMRSTFGPEALLGPAAGALWSQWRNEPEEWGPGWAGFGRRFASGYGRQVISNTVVLGIAAVDHEVPNYEPSNLQGVFPRARYAFMRSFIARRDTGGDMIRISSIAGAYSAAFASNAWYPARLSNTHEALIRGSTAMLGHVISNEFHEFFRFHRAPPG